MEINPYGAIGINQLDVWEQDSAAAVNQEAQTQPELLNHEDRVDIVRSQNLAAVEMDVYDVETAFQLLGQVEQDFAGLEENDLASLYRYDHLRLSFAQ